jgi:hypothetical protein
VRLRVSDSRKHVNQILGGLDTVCDAAADERVQTGDVSAGARGRQKVVLPSQGDNSQPTLRAIVVDWDPASVRKSSRRARWLMAYPRASPSGLLGKTLARSVAAH